MKTDYQMFTTRDMSIADRRELNVGDIWSNAIRCKKCKTTIRSKNRHDMALCKCSDNKIFIDGGSWYSRIGGNPDNIEDLIQMYFKLPDEPSSRA